jgi:hypothetical protein
MGPGDRDASARCEFGLLYVVAKRRLIHVFIWLPLIAQPARPSLERRVVALPLAPREIDARRLAHALRSTPNGKYSPSFDAADIDVRRGLARARSSRTCS